MESFVSLGRIHIPVHALIAAAGLMVSLALGLRTAVLAKIDRDAFWDFGLFSVGAALLLSRILLIAENFNTFRQFPIAVLELPAVSAGGLLVTVFAAFWYLRRRRLPLLGALDAAAPCAALFWAFLDVADFADGTREGMPSAMPWAITSSFGRVHPVEIYMALCWLLAAAAMFWVLTRQRRRGQAASFGLILAGLVFIFTDFFRLPNQLYGNQVLDGIQWRGLEMIVVGSLMLAWRLAVPERTASPRTQTAAADAV